MMEDITNKMACDMCAIQNKSGCTQIYSPDPNHWICKAWLARARVNRMALNLKDELDRPLNKYLTVKDAMRIFEDGMKAATIGEGYPPLLLQVVAEAYRRGREVEFYK